MVELEFDFVAEKPEAPGRARAHRTLGDDAAIAALTPRRRLLDHEPSFWHVQLERGVVEVAAISPFEPCRYRLEDLSVQPHRVAAGAEW